MSALDAKMRATADRLVNTYGADATLVRQTYTGGGQTGKPTVTKTSEAVKVSPPSPVNINHIDGTLIRAGDMQAIIPALALTAEPEPGKDILRLDGFGWSIVASRPIWSGNQVAAYAIVLRR